MPLRLSQAQVKKELFQKLKKRKQAQGVFYLHGTKENPVYEHGGRLVYYPNGPG